MKREFETLRFELDRGLATITMTRGDRGNPLGAQWARDFRAAALLADETDGVRAVLLRSEGKHFCFGGDLTMFRGAESLGALAKDLTVDFHGGIATLVRMDAPLVVAVQGSAVGAGLSLAAIGDIVLAGESSVFRVAYPAIGLTADGAMTYTLPRLIGVRRFQELYFSNRIVSAEEAVRIGLITRLVADDALAAEAETVARALAAGPTRAYAGVRRLVLGTFDASIETQMELEARSLGDVARTADVREGVASVLERRPARFEGR